NLVFCFDGDRAGRKAAWRALEQSLPEVLDGKDIRFLLLPEEDDPDTYVRRLGKEAFLDALKNAKPLSTFLFDELSAQVDLAAEEGRARLLALAKPLISQVTAPALALMLRRRLAEMVGLGATEMERLIPLGPLSPPYTASVGKPSWPQPHQARSLSPARAAAQNVVLRKKDATLSPPLQLIARMLIKPRLAMRFDITTPEDDPSELGAACRVAVFIRDHDLEASQAQIVEHFRGTQDEGAIQRAISRPLLGEIDPQKIDLESEFDNTLARLREEALAAEKRAEINRRAREMGLD
ncbi:MAG: hypothetical protein JNM52_05470, partial [Betaproteobacteria bacterium]|nr:hypothetical protein [Betaproteobacteria bacterium]